MKPGKEMMKTVNINKQNIVANLLHSTKIYIRMKSYIYNRGTSKSRYSEACGYFVAAPPDMSLINGFQNHFVTPHSE